MTVQALTARAADMPSAAPHATSNIEDPARIIEAVLKPAHLRLAEDGLASARVERAKVFDRHCAAGILARDAGKIRDDNLDRLTKELELADNKVARARLSLKDAQASSAVTFLKQTAELRAAIATRLTDIAASLDDALAALALIRKAGERFGIQAPHARAGIDSSELRAIARGLGRK
jgi:hypothetical protein